MKLLVMSDSHRNIENMQYAIGQTKPDAVLHLGDHVRDAIRLSKQYPTLSFQTVIGNCDYPGEGELELFLTFEGVRVFATHGHKYGVKSGLDILVDHAKRRGANVLLFGHTHRALLRQESGMWVICPGQMERHSRTQAASYGVVEVLNGKAECSVELLPSMSRSR